MLIPIVGNWNVYYKMTKKVGHKRIVSAWNGRGKRKAENMFADYYYCSKFQSTIIFADWLITKWENDEHGKKSVTHHHHKLLLIFG